MQYAWVAKRRTRALIAREALCPTMAGVIERYADGPRRFFVVLAPAPFGIRFARAPAGGDVAMSRSTFNAPKTLPVAHIALIRRPIAPPFEHDDAFARIDELLDLEAPTRRSHDLARELAATCARMDAPSEAFEEERPTLMVGPQENLRLLAAAFAEEEITIEAPSPSATSRIASFVAESAPMDPPRSGVVPKADSQTLLVAGIWAAALSVMGVLAFFLTGA